MSTGAIKARDIAFPYLADAGAENLPPRYKHTEVGIIPEDWDCAAVVDVARLESGHTPSRRRASYWNGPVPWVSLHDTASLDGATIANTAQTITEDGISNSSARLLPEGTVVFSRTATVGKSTILGRPMATSQDFANYICGPRLHNRYLVYLLRSMGPVWKRFMAGSIHNTIYMPVFESLRIALPPITEQRAIAEALSNVDELLGALEALIAKKRVIKKAAMQRLLTGKTRLPGFSGPWETRRLGEIGATYGGLAGKVKADFGSGSARYVTFLSVLNNVVLDPGELDFVNVGPTETQNPVRMGDLLFNGTSETPGDLAMGAVVGISEADLFLNSFCFGFRIQDQEQYSPLFFAYFFRGLPGRQLMHALAQGATRYNMSKGQFMALTLSLPSSDEQTAITTVLSDMDAEIAALERRRDKTRAIKQGMMQQLLTGRVRLMEPETEDPRTEAATKKSKGHSWAFNEAVVIATIARHFGTEQFPLGRMRYTKLSYLLHRHAERSAEGYRKKAAGPYNPRTRYGGPEKISLQNGYVRKHTGPKGHSGFVAGDNIAQAKGYFEQWYGPETIYWLEQFRKKTNDDLELLTTVDMAAEELRTAGKDVHVAGVMDVIRIHPEWKAKLDRPVFSDLRIQEAIETSRQLFGPAGVAPDG